MYPNVAALMSISLPLTFSQLLLSFGLAGSFQEPAKQSSAPIIRMDVGLVLVHATVTDSKGNVVTGLTESAFQLLVDDKPHPISFFQGEDAPVAAGVILDNSASMVPVRAEVIAAALAFARSSNPLDEMFVVHVSSIARLALPAEEPFTNKISILEGALATFTAGGSTALFDGTGLGLAHLEKASIPKRILLIISDGGDNSSHITLPSLLNWAQTSHVSIYCIGLFNDTDQDKKPGILKQLAEGTGGKAYFPSDVSAITRVSVEIAKEIRSQYTLGFSDIHDVKYHRIRLIAEDPARSPLIVHTRAGYTSVRP